MTTPLPVALRKPKRSKSQPATRSAARQSAASAGLQSRALQSASVPGVQGRLAFAAVLALCGLWSYWPTLIQLVNAWVNVADYAHGFFVGPLALYFLWIRRDRFPGLAASSPLLAVLLLAVSLLMRLAGDAYYFVSLDGWSLVPWVAAVCALLGGLPLLGWCWPSLVFLVFMVPLPFSLETDLSGPLQRVATIISTQVLQFLGQPGFAEGNVIVLGNERLEVAQACSGLRLFMGTIALTYAYVVVIRRPLWEKLVLVAAAAPIAIVANASRIVATGLLCQLLAPGPAAREWIHDGAGWGMIVVAAALFWALLQYLQLLVKEENVMDMTSLVKQCRV